MEVGNAQGYLDIDLEGQGEVAHAFMVVVRYPHLRASPREDRNGITPRCLGLHAGDRHYSPRDPIFYFFYFLPCTYFFKHFFLQNRSLQTLI
jgi:hypothetical protein